jgi:RES domain
MELDDPAKPEFASWSSYREFERRVRHTRRFVWKPEVRAFLDTVGATLKGRDVKISDGTLLYRAQLGIDYDPVNDEDGNQIGEEPHGFDEVRMKPLSNRAKEGRVNPAGITVLYLASAEKVAVSEVRPWVGSELSVAQFEIVRDLKAVNLSVGHGLTSIGHLTFAHLLGEEKADAETKEKAVWIDIDNAFSRPVTPSDDLADYVPTQILAELFRDADYDAIIYRSQFGEKGYNIALFNPEDAEPINCAPYQVTVVDVVYKVIGNRWFLPNRRKQQRKKV